MRAGSIAEALVPRSSLCILPVARVGDAKNLRRPPCRFAAVVRARVGVHVLLVRVRVARDGVRALLVR
eukprot:4233581-Prymnesium_polylepis.1